MGPYRPATGVLTRILLVLCLALGAVIYLEADRPLVEGLGAEAASTGDASAAPRAAAPPPSVTMPPLSKFAEVLLRPPFSETRRPAPPEAARPTSAEPLAATLVGVVLTSQDRHALIEHGDPPLLARLTEGEQIDGWTIKAILRDRIIVGRGDASGELKIKDKSPPNQPQRNPPAPDDAAAQPGDAEASPPPRRLTKSQMSRLPITQAPAQNGATALPPASDPRARRPLRPGPGGG